MNNYPIIKLRRGKDEAVRRYHPWIFSGAIETATPNIQAGDLVTIVDYKNEILGTGFAEAGNIAVKILVFENIKIDLTFMMIVLKVFILISLRVLVYL